MRVIKYLIVLLIVVFVTAVFYVLLPKNGKSDLPKITTSIYPLYFFTQTIAGHNLDITNLTPAGAEPHDFEPSTRDIANIFKSRLLIVNGKGLEPWLDNLSADFSKTNTIILKVSDDLSDGSPDPHIWLDPVFAKSIVRNISSQLVNIKPENKAELQKNTSTLLGMLDQLDSAFKTSLANCQTRTFITSHQAFDYLAKRYNLKQISIAGLSPEEEPSPQKLGELSKLMKSQNLKYVFIETLASPRFSQSLADEVGANTLVLNPIEGLSEDDIRSGSDYFSIQKSNLQNLKIALQCK